MKDQMRLIITDDPVSDVKMALAKEHHDRTQKLRELVAAGHVTVLEDNDAVRVRLQIEDEVFGEERQCFPSTELMARLQLAVHAGRSERNNQTIRDYHASDAMNYAALGKSYHQQLSRINPDDPAFFMPGDNIWYEEAAKIPAKITATVKAKAKAALRKGLRP